MEFGYVGRVVLVDLTEGKIAHEELESDLARKILGGAGFGRQ